MAVRSPTAVTEPTAAAASPPPSKRKGVKHVARALALPTMRQAEDIYSKAWR